MRYVQFEVIEDENMDGSGILPNIFRRWDNYSPAIAVGALGHDLIEHGCRETGAFHQEVAAIGSYLFTRLLSGNGISGNSYYTSHQLAASNMAQTWNESTSGDFPTPPKVKIPDESHSEMFDDFVSELRPAILEEWQNEAGNYMYDEGEELPECPYATDENWSKFVGWLRFGYARAYRRFDGDDYLAYRLYTAINKTIERHWDALEQYTDTGRKFTLAIDKHSGTVELLGDFI